MEPTYLQRLSFIKYLFSTGFYQSYQPEPLYGLAVLSFHDSVELFLQLSLEKLDINKTSQSFMDYWDIIDKNLKGKKLSQKESTKKLNRARVDLKHHGIIPSKLDIESFRATTYAFFNENCPVIFHINFDNISLIDIIKFKRPRGLLKQAKSNFEKGLIDECIQSLALSFEYLILDYEESKKDRFHGSPFFFGESIKSLSISSTIPSLGDLKIKDFFDRITKSIEAIQKATKILSFGIDYKKYIKFRSIAPTVRFSIAGTPIFSTHKEIALSKEDLDFCINFIVESSLKLQDFDFELSTQ